MADLRATRRRSRPCGRCSTACWSLRSKGKNAACFSFCLSFLNQRTDEWYASTRRARARARPVARRKRSDSSRCRFAPPSASAELGEDRRRLGVHASLLAPLGLQPLAQLADSASRASKTVAHVQLRRDRAVPLVRLEPKGDVVVPHPAQAVELAAQAGRRSRCPHRRPSARTRKLRCFPSPTVARSPSSQPASEQRHVRVAEPERREPRELLAEVERQVRAVDERVDRRSAGAGRPRRESRRRARRTPRRRPARSRARSRARPRRACPPQRSRWLGAAGAGHRAGRSRRSSGPSPSSRRRCPRSARPGGA